MTSEQEEEVINTKEEAFDALREKLRVIDSDLNIRATKLKSPIYRKYAEIIARFIDKNMIQDELIHHFPKDRKIIRYALGTEYKGFGNKELDDSSRQIDKFGESIRRELEKNVTPEYVNTLRSENTVLKEKTDGLQQELEFVEEKYKTDLKALEKFYNHSDIEMDSGILEDIVVEVSKNRPDQMFLTQEKGKAVSVRTKQGGE